MTIAGTVTDPLTRPLPGVRVTDGAGHTVYTDAAGSYRIDESSLATYLVTASRNGLNPQTRVVGPTEALSSVNFTLTYSLSASVSPNAFNNTPPKTVTISATSYAPPAGQCVTFADALSGAMTGLSYQPPLAADGSSSWIATYAVPMGRADGTYTWTVTSTNCLSVTLTNTPSGTYMIDSVAPTVRVMLPADGGNVGLSSTSIDAEILDDGSGVNPSLLAVTLTDLAKGDTSSVGVVSFNPITGNLQSSNVNFVTGHTYRSSIQVTDYAGNKTTSSAEFLAVTWTFGDSPTIAVTYGMPQYLGLDATNGKAKWMFPDVTIRGSAYHANVSGTKHAGWGTIPEFIDLKQARVRYLVGGQGSPPSTPDLFSAAATAAIPAWSDGLILGQQAALIGKPSDFASALISIAPADAAIGSLTAYLPIEAEQPYITLDGVVVKQYQPGTIPLALTAVPPDECDFSPDLCDDPPPTSPPSYSKEYLVAYLSDDEANDLVLAIAAGEDATRCVQLPRFSPDWVVCRASETIGVAVGLALLPYHDGNVVKEAWAEASQLVGWWVGLGKRPTPQDLEQAANQAASNAATVQAASTWASALCDYSYCSAYEALRGWQGTKLMMQPCGGCDPGAASSYAEKCVDKNGTAVKPTDRKRCKQSGYISISIHRPASQQWKHYIHSGWYRTRGTPDGKAEDLGPRWSGSDEAAGFHYSQSNIAVYVGAKSLVLGGTNCDEKSWTSIANRTNYSFWDSLRLQYASSVLSTQRLPYSNTNLGMGQMFTYLQFWNEGASCTPSGGSSATYNKESRAVSTSLSLVASEASDSSSTYHDGYQGQIATRMVHHFGPSGGETFACALTTAVVGAASSGAPPAAAAAMDFLGAFFGCNLGDKEWEMDSPYATQEY
jgi:hypothetical protein